MGLHLGHLPFGSFREPHIMQKFKALVIGTFPAFGFFFRFAGTYLTFRVLRFFDFFRVTGGAARPGPAARLVVTHFL